MCECACFLKKIAIGKVFCWELKKKRKEKSEGTIKDDKMRSVNLQFSVHAMKFSLKILNKKFFSGFSVNF